MKRALGTLAGIALVAALGGGCDDDTGSPLDMTMAPDLSASTTGDMATAAADLATSDGSTDGSDDMPLGPDCTTYCTTITANCTTTNAQYMDLNSCISSCTTNYGWPAGKLGDTTGNTVGCRLYHSQAAATNATLHCPHAGPTGANTCGTWCENFCDLAMRNCTGNNAIFPDRTTCMMACSSIPTTGKVNDTTGDTIQCRIYHLGLAGTDAASAVTHCPHGTSPSAVCK